MSRSFELLSEACAGLPYRARKMFGGYGFFAANGGMFAGIVTNDEVVFKLADEAARTELIAAGGHPWTFEGGGRAMTMQAWIVVPEDFYDDPERLAAWASRAHRLVPGKLAARAKGRASRRPGAGAAPPPARPRARAPRQSAAAPGGAASKAQKAGTTRRRPGGGSRRPRR
ncbi:MAG: TfoX/Sxy family protein [Myxococcaceae bacterium]|jgi:DNA transformation protein|nr:TfoX/Sxy family protein [Myxococcaceae bacterium]MCA3014612.1 TfoX/Sxy family protein [Myxococcaceae bacterium]